MMLEPVLATLVIGIVIGYVGQRSRMCFVGGLRDFLLVRDSELLRGLLAFFVTAWVGFSLVHFLEPDRLSAETGGHRAAGLALDPAGVLHWFGSIEAPVAYVGLTAGAAFLLGLLSVLANGCPFRQHVLAAQGSSSATFYLVGFYGGMVLYGFFIGRFLLGLVTG